MGLSNIIGIERVRYWEGQLLASVDLQTQISVEEELRRLHIRDLHGAYGIAIGLGLAPDQALTLQDTEVQVPCGLAYDCGGRALVVAADRKVKLPQPVTDGQTLVLSFDPAAAAGSTVKWKSWDEVNPNIDIPI